jgi:CelD/BcsL family acetyltransferase involved in cellulose biosynthesis
MYVTSTEEIQTTGRVEFKAINAGLTSRISDFSRAMSGVLSEQWQELNRRVADSKPFDTPEWYQAFSSSFADEREARILTVSRGGSLVGVLPLQRANSFFGRVPARTIRSLSGIHSCRFDLISDESDDLEEIAQVAWSELERDHSWQVIEALDVPENGNFFKIVKKARAGGFLVGEWPTRFSPVLRLPDKGTDPFSNCPRGFRAFRKKLQAKLDALSSQGEISFRVDTMPYEDGLAKFMRLESSGWKGANGSAIVSNLKAAKFYSYFVEHLQRKGVLRVYSLNLSDKPIAMQLGLFMNGVYYSPKVAYDESFSKFAPGHLLVRYLIGDLVENNARMFEFLGPRAFWKTIWTKDVVRHSNLYIFRPGLKGRTLHGLTMGLGPRLRSLKHRWFGDPQSIA